MTRLHLVPAVAAVAVLLAACGGASEKELIEQANAALAKEDRAAALISIKNAIQKNPQSGEARYLLGKTLLDNGEAANAAVELRKARELHFDEGRVVPALVKAMLASGDRSGALLPFNELKLTDPQAQADVKTSIAQALAAEGNADGARQMIDEALQASPTFALALLLEARFKASEGDIAGALAVADKVLAADARDEQALMLKGDLLAHGSGDRAGALKAWRAALDKQPRLLSAHREIVLALLGDKDLDGAAAQVEAMKRALPNHPDTRFFTAQIAFYRNDYATARDQIEQVLKLRPEDPLALQLAGLADYQLQSYTTAENFLARALKANGNLVLARETLAQIYLRTRQPNKAIDLLAPMAAAPNPPARTVALLAEAYARSGDNKRSDELYARAAKSEPDNKAVRAAAAYQQAQKGDDKALLELEQLATEDKSLRTDLAVVRAQLGRRNVDGALKAIDTLVAKAPDKPIGYLLRGRVLMLKQDDKGATEALEKAVAVDPKYLPAVVSMAALDLQHGQAERARKRFDDLIAKDPKNARALIALAELKLRSGAPTTEVSATLQQAVKADPTDARARVALVNHFLARGDAKAALTAARDAAAALPSSLEVMDVLGVAQIKGDDTQQAISTFKKLAALQPTATHPLLRLGDAYLAARDLDGATQTYKKAVELQADLLPAQRALADIAVANRRVPDAIAIARTVQKQRAGDPAGWLIEGDAEVARKGWDAALAAYRSALAKAKSTEIAARIYKTLSDADKPAEAERFASSWLAEHAGDAGFLYVQGDIALGRGQLAAAENYYRAVLKAVPNHALALNNVAWLLLKQGKPGALEFAQKANTLMPDQAAVLDTLALALLAENQAAKALEVQKRAVERAPGATALRLTLARCYLKTGDKAQARAELDNLAKLGPKFPQQAEVAELLKSV